MKVSLHNISKRYDTAWVIKDLDLLIEPGDRLAIRGLNGSGKSTLLKMISAYLSPSKGHIHYEYKGQELKRNELFRHVAISAAYSELDEELSAIELFEHFRKFKKYLVSDSKEFIDLVDLQKQKNKAIKNYSSGMKQRLNLALAVCMDTPLLLIDEPSSFLDKDKIQWFKDMIGRFAMNKTLIVASNVESDLDFCTSSLSLEPL